MPTARPLRGKAPILLRSIGMDAPPIAMGNRPLAQVKYERGAIKNGSSTRVDPTSLKQRVVELNEEDSATYTTFLEMEV